MKLSALLLGTLMLLALVISPEPYQSLPHAEAATYTVTSLASTGPGTLRQAIQNANATTGIPDVINFSVSGTITLGSQLNVTDDLTINGSGITLNGGGATRIMSVGQGADVTLNDLSFLHGGSSDNGGAIYNSDGTLTITSSTFTGNTASIFGGAIYNFNGTLDITSSTFSDNAAADDGGAIFHASSGITLTITGSTFTGNTAGSDGGAIYNGSPLMITGSTFSSNAVASPLGRGGAIYTDGTSALTSSTFTGNTTPRDGGAIYNGDTLAITGSTFSDNIAYFDGGAIYNVGPLTITGSTFTGNQATNNGGAIGGGNLTITNSTFTGNQATSGGAIFRYGSTLAITSSTFSGNTGSAGSGTLYSGTGTVNVTSSIIVGGNCTGTTTDGGNNLSFNAASCPGTVADPQLGPLQNNGGPTDTMLPALTSPAVDAYAAPCATTSDQRGITRPQGPLCDIGATEQDGTWIVDTLVDESDGDYSAGDFSLREAVELANGAAGADAINFSVTGTISLTAGQLEVTDDLTLNGSGIMLDGNNATRIMLINSAITVTINDLTFQNGSAITDIGGAINNFGTLTITNSTLSGNSADVGGAINNTSTLTITNSTFSGNSAADLGGAITNTSSATATITNSTFSGNSAADLGGAILNSGTLAITNSTFGGNMANNVGGTLYHAGSTNVASTLIVGGDCFGTITDGGNNLSFNAAGCPNPGMDPQLGPLQNNGGSTATMLPATNGPAVEAYATPCATATDQRGIARPQGFGCDIGATEQDGSVVLASSAVCNGPNLDVTITAGDGPFHIISSAGINTPVLGVSIGTTTINGPEKWDDLTVMETTGNPESVNLGQFRCRSNESPVPVSPAHRSRTTSAFPLFSWTGISSANNYRVFVFDDANPATRTVDIRQNSGGPTNMQLSTPLPNGRLFWRTRGRQNRIWSLWSIRFTLFKDPIVPLTVNTPVPAIELNPPSGSDSAPNPAPTFPAPPNSR